MNSHIKDRIGERHGRLVVIEITDKRKHRSVVWKCKCDCGNIHFATGNNLSKTTKSCGCYQKEYQANKHRTHDMSNTRLYRIWHNMRCRCLNPNTENYKYYGGRGIKVYDKWHKFEPFRDWALSNGYEDTLTIDRIDGDGNYEPSNCRWATWTEQAHNHKNFKGRRAKLNSRND